MKRTKLYSTPFARDLTGFGVVGMGVLGLCWTGSSPTTEECASGDNPEQNPEACSPNGLAPEQGACRDGGNVAHGCSVGSYV